MFLVFCYKIHILILILHERSCYLIYNIYTALLGAQWWSVTLAQKEIMQTINVQDRILQIFASAHHPEDICNTICGTFNHSWSKCNLCGQRYLLQVEMGSPGKG